AECCLAGGIGAEVALPVDGIAGVEDDLWTALFGEGPGGFLLSGTESGVRALGRRTPVRVLGTVGGRTLRIAVGGELLEASLGELAEAHGALAALFP
ncbi:MAG: phosphoribosylformylglycinamidine synthase subunit PurL, partial [Solirubrobacteraceae bacterium]